MLILDTGNLLFKTQNFSPRFKEQWVRKADTLITAFNLIGCDALNIGERELANGLAYLQEQQQNAKFPFISANLAQQSSNTLIFPAFVVKQVEALKVGIFGLMEPAHETTQAALESEGLTVWEPMASARKVLKQLQQENCDLIIALAQLSDQQILRLVQEVPGIHLILSGRGRSKNGEVTRVKDTLILYTLYRGGALGVVDVDIPRASVASGKLEVDAMQGRIVPLDKTMSEDQTVVELVQKFNETIHTEQFQHVMASGSPAQLANPNVSVEELLANPNASVEKLLANLNVSVEEPPYVGQAQCQKCHTKQYDFVQTTRHTKAFQTLVGQHREYDLECLGCHMTGYSEQLAFFIAYLSTPERYQGVQCEVCHGAGKGHTKEGEMVLKVPKEVCLKCHTVDEHPNFDYDASLGKIACPKGKANEK